MEIFMNIIYIATYLQHVTLNNFGKRCLNFAFFFTSISCALLTLTLAIQSLCLVRFKYAVWFLTEWKTRLIVLVYIISAVIFFVPIGVCAYVEHLNVKDDHLAVFGRKLYIIEMICLFVLQFCIFAASLYYLASGTHKSNDIFAHYLHNHKASDIMMIRLTVAFLICSTISCIPQIFLHIYILLAGIGEIVVVNNFKTDCVYVLLFLRDVTWPFIGYFQAVGVYYALFSPLRSNKKNAFSRFLSLIFLITPKNFGKESQKSFALNRELEEKYIDQI